MVRFAKSSSASRLACGIPPRPYADLRTRCGPSIAFTLADPSTLRAQVVFKSLIVLHTVMRSGQLDAVFSYLSNSSTSLSLSSPEGANVAAYGQYLGCRIKSYGNLKRDVVRDKSDRRAANRLKTLTVEQGLLRETREIQRMIAALVEAKVSLADPELLLEYDCSHHTVTRSSTMKTSMTTCP